MENIEVYTLWEELEDIPLDLENETICEKWLWFDPGTSKYEICKWLEDTFDVAIHNIV